MADLREADVRALLELVGESNAQRSLRAFRTGILPGLRRLIPCEIAAYDEVEGRRRAYVVTDPVEALAAVDDPGATLARNSANHPLIVHHARTRDGRAYKLSGFVTRDQLHRLGIYEEVFRALGVEHQIAFTLPSQPTLVIGIALSRTGRHDFAERDRTLLNLARPALVQAYRNVASYARVQATLRALSRGLATRGEGVVTLDRAGAIEFVSPTAQAAARARLPPLERARGAPAGAARGGARRRARRGRAERRSAARPRQRPHAARAARARARGRRARRAAAGSARRAARRSRPPATWRSRPRRCASTSSTSTTGSG